MNANNVKANFMHFKQSFDNPHDKGENGKYKGTFQICKKDGHSANLLL